MKRSGWVLGAFVTLCLAVGLSYGAAVAGGVGGGSAAESLTRMLPDDTVGFVATSGCDALKPAFDKTIMGRIANDPGVQSFYGSVLKAVLAKVAKEPDAGDKLKQIGPILEYVRTFTGRPIALGIAQVAVKEGPPICGFVILDAGSRKAELVATVTKLEGLLGEGAVVDRQVGTLKMRGPKDANEAPVYWGWVENYLVVGINDAQGAAAKYVAKPRPASPEYLKKVPGSGDAALVYVDYQKVNQLISTVSRQEGSEEHAKVVTAVMKTLGVSGLRGLTVRAGFAGSDMVGRSLLEMSTPPTGVFSALRPAEPGMFSMVDTRAMAASVANYDLAGLYDILMKTILAASPNEAYPEVQKGLAAAEAEAKFSLRNGVLASLAGPVVAYALPAGVMPESPQGGFVVILKLKDGKLFEQNMKSLGDFAVKQSKGVVQVGSQAEEGRTVYSWVVAPLAVAQIMPTWSIVNDSVIIGSNPAMYKVALAQATAKAGTAKSLLDADGYKKAAAGLPKNVVSVEYMDTQIWFNQAMITLQQVWPMVTMAAKQADMNLPVMLPSLGAIAKDMRPSIRYCAIGPDGLTSYYRGSGIESSIAGVGGAAIGMGATMPALARTRGKAQEINSMGNLRQIGVSLVMYADDNQGKFPPDLQALIPKYLPDPKMLESSRKPKGFAGPSYIYVAGQSAKTQRPDSVLAYENPEFCTDKINVLFLDAHVEAMKPQAFLKALEATYKQLGREMPKIKFKESGEKPTPAPPKPPTTPTPGSVRR